MINMQILSEKEIEDILVLHPELIETGLTLLDRQAQLESRRTDLTFSDKEGNILLIELKKGSVSLDNVFQIKDYMMRLQSTLKKPIRGMLIGQSLSDDIKKICKKESIEWKEIKTEQLFSYIQKSNQELFEAIFIEGKLHEEAKNVQTLSFHDYLNQTSSPYGGAYTSYQFFKPRDASPELSENNEKNQLIADGFIQLLMEMSFDRYLFNRQIRIRRVEESMPKWSVTAKGAWQGYEIPYLLTSSEYPSGIPCELYIGTIGYRGNKPIFADEKSRFLVVRIGGGKRHITTQYGFHKYLQTDKQALFPFYELKYNPKGLPKHLWERTYELLDKYSYKVSSPANKTSYRTLSVGEVSLKAPNVSEQLGNLIEALFAVTVLKSHFKDKEKGFVFEFLH